MAKYSNRTQQRAMGRLLTFLKLPFFEQKYIILVKLIRLFCDGAYISKRTLKVTTRNSFLKIGYLSSLLTTLEIANLERIESTGFAKYLLPFTVIKFAHIGIIWYSRANVGAAPFSLDTELG